MIHYPGRQRLLCYRCPEQSIHEMDVNFDELKSFKHSSELVDFSDFNYSLTEKVVC